MSRFILVVFFIVGIISIFSLDNLNYKVSNKKFSFSKQKEKYELRVKEIEALTSHHEKKEHVVQLKKKGPLVQLVTESLKNGHKLFKKCAICHGKSGAGKKAQKAPAIGGQFAWYIEKQITDMQNGVRLNKIMNPYIKKLSVEDIKNLADYISKLPWKE